MPQRPQEPGTAPTTRPALSVVVPVFDGARVLPRCLEALRADAGADVEILVVDDASRDGSAGAAAHLAHRVIRLEHNAGPGPARNAGARAARAEVLVFVDADVAVRPGALARLRQHLDAEPRCAAVFGSYDAEPVAPGLVSQYRNLLHHFVHQRAGVQASHFWAGLGAVRRDAFFAVGGFDEGSYARVVEDIELGYRLRAAGHEIHLDKEVQGTHLKRWTLASMLRTDLGVRAIPWTRLLLSRRALPSDFSLDAGSRWSVVAAWLAVACAAGAVWQPRLVLGALLALGALAALNRELLGFLAARRGVGFAAAALLLHALYAFSNGVALLAGLVSWWITPDAERGLP
jgi:glycosyltransferase involved in cell wall biosynthesis